MNPKDEAAYKLAVETWCEQIFSFVKRSQCDGHFESFFDFHENLEELCHAMIGAIDDIKAKIFACFPPLPLKVGKYCPECKATSLYEPVTNEDIEVEEQDGAPISNVGSCFGHNVVVNS
ncbi:hypothetical protein FRX31_017948 [Thalictrum thalictroides]|uniref:Uncharacterized protein n=1 Tax=Thalictrum thalictroides TaxID=46969 RepID=A0A7J6W7Z4_THATH|nr:hypothetical protein FRX31_017948 [Thalictrum thalictroides]